MGHIFLSYAGEDRGRVAPLVAVLEAQSLEVWWDRDIDYGLSFHQAIETALTAADCVVVVWSRASVESAWVLNEASDALRRARLLPVLFDAVRPPLEFRHLQTADLSDWNGDPADPRFTRLHNAVVAMLGRSSNGSPRPPVPLLPPPQRAPTWMNWTKGLVALGAGLCVLLLVLWRAGLIFPASEPADSVATGGFQSGSQRGGPAGPPPEASNKPQQGTPQSPRPSLPDAPPASPPAPARERVNLLDTGNGAQLVTTNQSNEIHWPTLFTGVPTTAPVYLDGFAVLALRGDQPVTFDTLAVFVNRTSGSMSVKELALYTSETSPGGPFVKAAQVTVPDYQDLRNPFHEFRFAPVRARFVKLQVLSFHPRAPGNLGDVGSIRLYASDTVESR